MLEGFNNSMYILKKNYEILFKVIELYKSNPEYFFDNEKRGEFFNEFSRCLHNYLASISSLVDHIRVIRKQLNNLELDEWSKLNLSELKNNDIIVFLQNLRNYTQHYKLPLVKATISFTPDGSKAQEGTIDTNLVLSKVELLKWDSWGAKSRKFIENSEENIDMEKLIVEYQEIISKNYNEFIEKVRDLYSKQIKEFEDIKAEMKRKFHDTRY